MSNPQTNSGQNSLPESLNVLKDIWKKKFSQLSSPYTPLDPHSYKVVWNGRMRSRAGVCNPRENLIELNPNLLKTSAEFEQTLVHELCHLAVCRTFPYAQAHGMRWKKLMVHFGFRPARCHNLEGTVIHRQKRWDVHCQCQIHKVTTRMYNKMKKGISYRCLSCKTNLQGPRKENLISKFTSKFL